MTARLLERDLYDIVAVTTTNLDEELFDTCLPPPPRWPTYAESNWESDSAR